MNAGVRIVLLTEGRTETALKHPLNAYLKRRVNQGMPKLLWRPFDGLVPRERRLHELVRRHLQDPQVDFVVALTDVYTGRNPPWFIDAADAKRQLHDWVGNEPRFYAHAAQFEFEAWLLPYWEKVQRMCGSTRPPPKAAPENVNHQRPPSTWLKDLFQADGKKHYSKVRDATSILHDADLEVAASQCTELQSFLSRLVDLSCTPK